MTAGGVSATVVEAIRDWLGRRTGDRDVEAGTERAWRRFLTAEEDEIAAADRFGPGEVPYVTEGGRWQTLDIDRRSDDSGESYDHGNWFAGFRAGNAWLHALGTGVGSSRAYAARLVDELEVRATDTTTHDLGFLFHPASALPTLVADGTLKTDPAAGLTAAATLAARWNERTGLLQAFGPIGSPRFGGTSTIDTMMNLPLLWWAAEHGGDPWLADVARRHARTSARLYLRPDASTYHLLRLDRMSGAVLDRGTFQGDADASCWSRGQAWAVCGFAWAYAATGETELLEAADRTAAYFAERLPADGIPPWDFTATAEPVPDSSAAAAVALGGLLLGRYHPDREAAEAYTALSQALLTDLGDRCVNISERQVRPDGILLHSTYSLPHGHGIDAATGFGDHYVGLAAACAVGAVAIEPLATGRSPRTTRSRG